MTNKEAFEAWCATTQPRMDTSPCLYPYRDCYWYAETAAAWEGWKAAIELAKPEQYPAWHDAPNCSGNWLGDYGVASTVTEHDVKTWNTINSNSRWYGPIPEDAK